MVNNRFFNKTNYLYYMEEILKLYVEERMSIKNIAKKTHHWYPTVKKYLIENGINVDDPDRTVGPNKKPKGYWGIKENNEREASKYEKSSDFYRYCSSAAKYATENGWMDEYCEKYFKKEIRYQSFDKRIHLIYAYEFKDANMVYIGRTNNINRRDHSHRKATRGDSLTAFSLSTGIDIPEPIIKECSLTAEESLIREDYWLNTYKNDGWGIINVSKTGRNSGSLGATPRKWTYETCKELAATCKNKEEFKKKSSRAHNVSRENGWIDEFFPEPWRTPDGAYDDVENCKAECVKRGFKSLSDIKKNYPFLYFRICKNKWNDEFREFFGNTKYKHYNKK